MTDTMRIHILKYFCGRRGKGRRKSSSLKTFKPLFALFLFIGICFLTFSFILHSSQNTVELEEESDNIIIDLSNNYFQSHEQLTTGNFLVNTEKCQIPDLNIWDAGIRPLIGPPSSKYNCSETHLMLTFVEKDVVVINEEAFSSIGYTLEQITCCYTTIERVEQNKTFFDMDADNLFRYSEECFKMEKFTKPKSIFIKVICKAKVFFDTFEYTNFHMIAMLPDMNTNSYRNENITRKLSWWEDCLSETGSLKLDKTCKRFREYGRPPNILVLGWDSTSRANFHRFMHKTNKFLENVLKPVEMVGYNKVGENTFPNFVPLMSSLSAKELAEECFANNSVPFDDCPFIWKKFNDHNYLTAHLEDASTLAIFNYLKTGFLKAPVDIYPRPFMYAAYKSKVKGDLIDCIEYQRPEEMILNYIADFAELAESKRIPYFLTSWLTDLTHESMNNLQNADALTEKTLKGLYEKGLLENTVLFVMSDHGYRFLAVRMTTVGWYEDKLPALWIKLPPSISKINRDWVDSLQSNSRNLITPFDLHEGFRHILNTYWNPDAKVDSEIAPASTSIRGVSPFSKVPIRSCDQAEIPTEYCACTPPTACTFSSVLLKLAAEFVVQYINTQLPPECTPLKATTVIACGTIRNSDRLDYSGEKGKLIDTNAAAGSGGDYELNSSDVVIVSFQTRPGNFLFEAVLNYNKTARQFSKVSNLLRMNQIKTSTACLVNKVPAMELLCYCDPPSSVFSIF